MLRYALKRVIMALITLFIIVLILFILLRVMPGSPFTNDKLTEAQVAAMYAKYGLDKPIIQQFFIYLKNLLKGDFGVSYNINKDIAVSIILKGRIWTSFRIGILSVLIGSVCGLVIGTIAALHKDTAWDGVCTVISIVGVSVPSYVLMLILMNVFAYNLAIFPNLYNPSKIFLSSVLPSISLSIFTFATITKFTRNEMIEVLESDYMQLAESKGMYGKKLIIRHALRNSFIPILTVLAPLVVDLMTGALVVEKIYSIDGIGKLMVDAVSSNDYNIVMAIALIYSVLYIGVMLVVDLLYGLIDPRIRIEKGGSSNG